MQRKSSYIDIIFESIRDNMTAKAILKSLLEQFLKPYQTSSQLFSKNHPNQELVEKMLRSLKKNTDTDRIAITEAINHLIFAYKNGISLDDNLLTLFAAFFSIFQHYIALLTTYTQMKSAQPLLTRIKITKNLWLTRFTHNLNFQRENIYNLSDLRNSICHDLELLRNCIKENIRREIIADILQNVSKPNFYMRKRACNTLGLLNKFIPKSQGPEVVNVLIRRLIDPKINIPERIEVEIEASKTVGLLSRFIQPENYALLFAYAFKRLSCQNPDLKIAIMEMTARLLIRARKAKLDISNEMMFFMPFLMAQLDSENDEIATAACALLCKMRTIVPEKFHNEITESVFLLLKKPALAKIACQTLGYLYPIVPEAQRPIAILKLYGVALDGEPYEYAARTIVIYKKYLDAHCFNQDIQVMLEMLDSNESDEETFIISLLAHLSPCLASTHLLQLVNHIMLKLINGGFFDKCNSCKALGNIGKLVPESFIHPVIQQLKKIAHDIMTSKYAIIALIKLKEVIPHRDFPAMIKFLLIQWQRHSNHATQLVILDAIKTFGVNIPENLQKILIKRLCLFMMTPNSPLQNEIGDVIISLFPSLTPDIQIFLLGQIANQKDPLCTKVFIYCNHLRSQNITYNQYETQILSYIGIEDVAHLIRQHM